MEKNISINEVVISAIINSDLEWDRTNHLASAIRAYDILSSKDLLVNGDHVRDKVIDVIMHHPDIYKTRTVKEDAELIFEILSNNNLLK